MLQASKAGAKQRAVPFWEAVNLITTCFKIMQIDVTLLFLCRDRRRRRGRERNNKRRGFVFGIRLRVVGRVYRRLISVERYCLPDTHTHTHEHQYANSTALLRPYKFLQHSPHFAVSYDLREDAGSHSEISVCASVCVCGCVCFRVALVQNSLHRLLAKKKQKKKQTHAFLETGECFLICTHTMSNPLVWLLKHQQCFSRG